MAKKRGNIQNLTPWKKGQSGNPNGRPRRVLTKLQKDLKIEFNVSLPKEDKLTLLESLLEMNGNQLAGIINDDQSPIFLVNIANAILKETKAGKTYALNSLFDRFFGKPSQSVDITSKGESLKPIRLVDDVK